MTTFVLSVRLTIIINITVKWNAYLHNFMTPFQFSISRVNLAISFEMFGVPLNSLPETNDRVYLNCYQIHNLQFVFQIVGQQFGIAFFFYNRSILTTKRELFAPCHNWNILFFVSLYCSIGMYFTLPFVFVFVVSIFCFALMVLFLEIKKRNC